jgi:hypothetical protein
MMGMHGESWVNHSIQEADLLIACGMRFDDRVTGSLATYAPKAKKIHIDIDPSEINKNVAVQVSLIGDLAQVLDQLLPRDPPARRRRVAAYHRPHEGRCGGSRHQEPARQWSSLRRACDQRSVACDLGRCGDHHRRGPAPDVGGAVLQARGAALFDHFRRPGDDGFCATRGHRRQDRLPGQGSVGHRRRRRISDDLSRAGHDRPGEVGY